MDELDAVGDAITGGLREVDVEGGTIVVELPEGFVEACGSTS